MDNCFNIPDQASRNRLEIYGTMGSILAEGSIGQDPYGKLYVHIAPQTEYEAQQLRAAQIEAGGREVEYEAIKMYAAEIDHFSRCVIEGKEPEISGEVGLWNMKVITACYESARTKKAVEVG